MNCRSLLRCARSLLLALAMLGVAAVSYAAVVLSVAIAPPVLPVYAQPICPGPGYIWTPGYWAYGPAGYFWVPGTWVLAPFVGALWTPGYWGWANGFYAWHAGYWGTHIGYYGGINYGFGYFGVGYQGGYWKSGAFYYNRTVNNVNVNVTKTYNTTINNANVSRVAYNGGTGGVVAQPTAQEEAVARETHRGATQAQLNHERTSSTNREMRSSVNQGRPSIAATTRPGAFAPRNAVAAEGAARPERSMPAQGTHARNAQGGGAQGGAGPRGGQPNAMMHQGQPPMQGQAQKQGQGRAQGQPHASGQGRGEGRGEGGGEGGGHPR
jgi:hypothetical protein